MTGLRRPRAEVSIVLRAKRPRYVMADISGLTKLDATAFALALVGDPGVAVVPGPSFFSKPEDGRALVRFCFCKRDETLDEAARRLQGWATAR